MVSGLVFYLAHHHEVFQVGKAGFSFGVIQGARIAGDIDEFEARGNFADVVAKVTQHNNHQNGRGDEAAYP